jgi:outer membrane protein
MTRFRSANAGAAILFTAGISAIFPAVLSAQTLSSPASTGTNQSTEMSSPATGTPKLGGPGGIGSGSPGPAVYTLSNAIEQTFKSSSDLQIALTDVDRDRALVSEAADAGHPQVGLDGTVTHLDSPISVAFGTQRIPVEPENTQTLDAAATLPIDISGQIKAATKAAELQMLADRFNVDRIRNALVLDAQTSYFNVLRAQHQLQVAQSALTDAQTQYKTAQTQFAGGIGQKIDVYRASTQVAQAQQSLLQAQNAYALSQNNFNDVVGRTLNAPVVAEDVRGVTAGSTVTANGQPPVVGAPDAAVPEFFAPAAAILDQINLQADIDKAAKARPELRGDMVNIEAAAKQITLARVSSKPTLSLSAVGDYYPTTDFQTPRHSLGVFSATIHIPVFDGGLARDRVRAAKDVQKNAETSYSSDQTTVELQVRQAYLNLYTASNQIAAANTALQQAIAARQLAQVRYANGVGLYLEVTDAEAALTSAENSQVNSVYDYLIARAQYQNAVGTPDLNPTL